MSLAYFMDHHVRSEITEGLRRRGIEVLTAFEAGAAAWDDERIFEHATQLGRILFSQDRHLLGHAHRWLDEGRSFAGLVYGHQLDVSIGRAIDDLELIAKVYAPDDMRDRVEYLPLS